MTFDRDGVICLRREKHTEQLGNITVYMSKPYLYGK